MRLVCGLASLLLALAAPVATADDGATGTRLSARTVFERIFQAKPNARPDLQATNLSRLDLTELDFKAALLTRADFYGSDLSGARLAGASLVGARLDRATITSVDFSNADLTDARMLRPTIFTTLEVATHEAPNFRGAKLVRTRTDGWLDRADFTDADLTGAMLGRAAARDTSVNAPASLVSANFTRATLKDAKLAHTSLQYARFIDADLRGADFRNADLLQADFSGANLAGADVTGANLDEVDLRTARGLDQVIGLAEALNVDTARLSP